MIFLRYRPFWAAVAASCLVVSNLHAAPTQKAASDDPFAFLPDDTKAVITVNFRQILDSALMKKSGLLEKMQEEMKNDKHANKVIGDLGINPLKDVDFVINAVSGDKDLKQLIIIKGQFDVKKFDQHAEALAKLKSDNIHIEKVPDGRGGSYKVYEITKLNEILPFPADMEGPAKEALGKKMYVGLDTKALLFSPDKSCITDALAKAAGHKTTTIKEEKLSALLAKTDANQALSLVVLTKALFKGEGVPGPAKDLEKLENIRGGINVTDEIKTEIILDAKDADSAKEINKLIDDGLDQAKNFVSVFSAQMESLKPFVTLLDGIKAETKEKAVIIRSTVKKDLLDNLATGIREIIKMQGGGN